MDFTSYITISPSNRISSEWDAVSHKYDPAVSEHRVEKVVLGAFAKNKAVSEAVEESKGRGCSFVLPGVRVIAVKVGQSSFGKTYQAVELTSEAAVVSMGQMYNTPRALRSLGSIKPDQSGLCRCVGEVVRLEKDQKMIFVPLASIETVSRGLSIPWRKVLDGIREVAIDF